jgi:hypothetical protein
MIKDEAERLKKWIRALWPICFPASWSAQQRPPRFPLRSISPFRLLPCTTGEPEADFLKEHSLVCGLFYGMAVELFMSFIVLPLSALHTRGPYQLLDLIEGLLALMVFVGLPISYSVRRFAK